MDFPVTADQPRAHGDGVQHPEQPGAVMSRPTIEQLLELVRQPNPTDPSRWDIAPGKHKAFSQFVTELQHRRAEQAGEVEHKPLFDPDHFMAGVIAASPSSPASGVRVTCVFCSKELGEDAVSDEAGALAHPACAEIELLTQKVEQYAAFVKLVDQSPQPERMSGAHLSKEARAQAAFAMIDNFKRQAAILSALGEQP